MVQVPMTLKNNNYLVNGLKHFSTLKEYNDQKKFLIDLIHMIKKKKNLAKKRTLHENLGISEKVFALAE